MTSEKKKVFGLSFLSVFLWASAFPLTKVAQQQFTSIPLGFLRCTVAAIFLIIIGKCCHIRLPQKKHIPLFFVSGGLGFTGYMITFNTGILTLTSATAYFTWGKAMSYAERTSEVTNFMFVTPLLSTIMGFIILHEVPNAGTFIGGAIIIISIVVFNLKGK